MKNMKKVLALLLAVALMAMGFAACTGSTEDPTKASGNETDGSANESGEGVTGGVIKIGATGPLTGSASSYGISVNNGAILAVEEINAAGGVNGLTFSFEMKDDEATPEKAASGYDQLYDDGMQISLGSVTSGACLAFGQRAAEDNVFFMTPSASNADVIETGDNAFRVCFGDPDQGVLAAEELTEKYTNIGCIYDTSDDYSAGVYEAFKEKMDELGVSFETRSFDQDNKTDFSAQVEGLKDCDVIFLPFYYQEAGLVARACQAKGLDDIVLFGCDGLDGVAGEIDDTVKNQISYITPFDVNSDDEKVVSFVEAYKAKYGVDPDQFAADGYDAIYAIVNAIQAAGVTDASISASDLCEAVKAAITDESFSYAGVTGDMTWDASGACEKSAIIVVVGE